MLCIVQNLYVGLINDWIMVKVEVDPGACGLPTVIKVAQNGPMTVQIELQSECQHIDNMAKELNEIDAYHECFKSSDNSKILEVCAKHCQHFSCPVPISIIKAVEVVLGLNTAKNVTITFSEEKPKQDMDIWVDLLDLFYMERNKQFKQDIF